MDEAQTIYSVNVFFKQLVLQRNIEEIALILLKDDHMYLVSNGQDMNDFFKGILPAYGVRPHQTPNAGVTYFSSVKEEMLRSERILSDVVDQKTFNVLVPFVPYGEYVGALYIRIAPDFTLLTDEVQSNFDRVSFAFSALVVLGLVVMYVVSSNAVRERNEARERLFEEHQANLEKQIRLEKESIFTKRIYHTHHKAEKIMGFIKNDVRMMTPGNLEESKHRVIAYSNFISRIIYDMKWYDQDINTIISPMFRTNVNSVIEFIPINCGSIPHELVESELFGYEKGSFTGAGSTKSGLFEIANKGTIFLDEVLELPLSAQMIMLRVIQESEIEKIGRAERMSINVRIITATNKNLAAEVERRTFSWRFVLPIECYPHRRCSTSTAG